MGKDGLIILLAFLFLISAALDWIELRDELRDMKEDEEYDKLHRQQEDEE